jgi:hypothetical protein
MEKALYQTPLWPGAVSVIMHGITRLDAPGCRTIPITFCNADGLYDVTIYPQAGAANRKCQYFNECCQITILLLKNADV